MELSNLYTNAKALIMPQEEDFGYVALEAQYFGCPVISYKKGGATETVVDGKTGIFFLSQTEKSLIQTVERFDKIGYNLRKNIEVFGTQNLKKFSKKFFVDNFLKNL